MFKRTGKVEICDKKVKKAGESKINLIKNPNKHNHHPMISIPSSIKNRKFILKIQKIWRKNKMVKIAKTKSATIIQTNFRSYSVRKNIYKILFFYYSLERLANSFRNKLLKYNVTPYFNLLKNNFAVKFKVNILHTNAKKIQKFVQKGLERIHNKKTQFADKIEKLFKKRKDKHFKGLIDSIKSKYLSDTLIKNQKVRLID